MYYLLEIKDQSVISKRPISEECYRTVAESLEATKTMRTIQEGFLSFHDALKELEDWCFKAPQDSEYLLRNLHTAERLCRSVLFEYRTFLDHTEKLLKKTFGKGSDAVEIFKQGTHDAYDQNPEYAFVYQLRNSMQHFDSIVHSFVAPSARSYVQPCSDPKKLLSDSVWKDQERRFILSAKGNIDLHAAFVMTYNAMTHIIVPVMNYLLNWNEGGAKIMMLRNWIESLFTREESKFFYLAETNDVGNITAIPVSWEIIYMITDSLHQKQQNNID